ncbi:hypothetical protein Daus18300_000743 [Diaporthe australafricana]|uniref:DUF7580 domain-containing protein n=1 Tax=Diaporthe australafricana TaxID=127596 RepID=A0ABR3Y1V2_9PEZI
MARSDKSVATDLISNVSKVADTLVTMLVKGQSPAAQTLRWKLGKTRTMDLKMSLALLSLELKNDTTRSHVVSGSGVMNLTFMEVGTRLEDVLNGAYIETFLDAHRVVNDRGSYLLLRKLASVLDTATADFAAELSINTDVSKLSSLIIVLQTFMSLVNDDIPDDHHQAHEDSMLAGKPPPLDVRVAAFEGPESIRVMAQYLHDALHSYWPCQVADHQHDGALGECLQAYMSLNPGWILPGGHMEDFFVILQGENMQQQCRVRFMKRDTNFQSDTLICEIPFEDTQEGCLPFLFNAERQLWDEDDELLLRNQLLSVNVDACADYELVPLRTLLKASKPTFEAKRIIEVILARSLLILIKGSWMGLQHCLSLDNIYVFCQVQNVHPQSVAPCFTEVFVSNLFGPHTQSSTNPKPIGRFSHPFPAIQAFGILLADIERGSVSGTDFDDEEKKGRKTVIAQAREALTDIADRLGSGSGVYQAIDFCLDRKSFGRYAGPGRDTAA